MPKKSILRIAIATSLIILISGSSFYFGFKFGSSQQKLSAPQENQKLINADFSLFWDATQVLKDKYFNIKDIKDQDLLYGAISGVVGALKDPNSVFFNPSDAKKFEEDVNGSFGGIGAELNLTNNQVIIIAPLKNTPAEAAGLKSGDIILNVNDTPIAGLTLDEVIKLIRGEPGTEVSLLISREGWKETKKFKITRQIITAPTLDWEIKPNNILYVRLYSFNTNVSYLFYQAVLEGMLKGSRGMILDLRNNPGGYLDVSVEMAGWFLKRGSLVVSEQFRGGEKQDFLANGNQALKNFPLVILVNAGSASASEILAGALRDNREIKLIGEKTFGKGTVQELKNLKDGSVIKISIAQWLTPKGIQINHNGLTPDIEVKMTDEDTQNKRDPQLDKALELINQLVK